MEKERIGGAVLLMASLLSLFLVVFQNKALFLKRFNFTQVKALYDQSQWQQSQNFSEEAELEKWAISKGYTGWNNYVDENGNKTDIGKTKTEVISGLKKKVISDAQLYAYAGYEYIHGSDPTLLNPEHPPLGKYLIGLSILAFGNEHVMLLIAGVLSLALLYYLVFLGTGSIAASALAVFLTTTHSLFTDQLVNGPQLDIFQLVFFLLLAVGIQKYVQKEKILWLIFSGIALGLLASIKTFLSYYSVFGLWLFLVFFLSGKNKQKAFKHFAILNIVALAVFTATYLFYFLQGGTFRSFLGVQKYIFTFYRQSGIDPVPYLGNYLRLIFTGTWKFWSGNGVLTVYDQWSILWMIKFSAGLFVLIRLSGLNKIKSNPLTYNLTLFFIVYNLFLFVFPIFPRYLLLLFVPIHALIAIYFLSKK